MKVDLYLAQIREERELSARKLAERSGISKTHILNIESGNTIPTITCLCQLAVALNVDVTELFSYSK